MLLSRWDPRFVQDGQSNSLEFVNPIEVDTTCPKGNRPHPLLSVVQLRTYTYNRQPRFSFCWPTDEDFDSLWRGVSRDQLTVSVRNVHLFLGLDMKQRFGTA